MLIMECRPSTIIIISLPLKSEGFIFQVLNWLKIYCKFIIFVWKDRSRDTELEISVGP